MTSHNLEAEQAYDLDPPEIAGGTPVAIAASALFRHESVIARVDLLERALVEAGLHGIGIQPVYDELARLEQDGSLLRLGPEPDVGQRWTTPSIAGVEAEMLRAANRPEERTWIDRGAAAAALEAAPHLSGEQQDAVYRAASHDGLSIIEAGAGTGKTTAARAIVDAAHRSGITVIGLAPSWVASDELAKSTGITATAIAKWRYDTAHGRGSLLDEKTLILVDEAGMAAMRDMAAIVGAAREAGAKLVLLGDSRQLESVPGGSALRAISEVVRQSAVMDAVRRQDVDWQRAASVVMAQGDAEAGLRAYARHGRVDMVVGTAEAMKTALETWSRLRAVHGEDVLIITRRNDDAARLNALVRTRLWAEQRLSGAEIVVPSINREKEKVPLNLAAGDLIRFSDTNPRLGIRNGNLGTIEAIRPEQGGASLRVRLEDGRLLEEPWQAFARVAGFGTADPPRIVHAYAGTAYSVQGRTAAASVHYIGVRTDAREIYVSLTRHRRDVRIVVEQDRLDAMCRQRQADPRIAPTSASIEDRLFQEASQYSEKANVVDFVADRKRFIATGEVTTGEDPARSRTSRLLEAARSLRQALRSFVVDEAVVPLWRLVDNGQRLVPQIRGALRRTVHLARLTSEPRLDRSPGQEHGIDR